MLGAAPYSVTKHAAATAYAEWLAATYAHRGLTVHCICPQGVPHRKHARRGSGRAGDVVMLEGHRDRAGARSREQRAVGRDGRRSRFASSCRTQEVLDYYQLRAANTDKWLRGMSRLQQRIEEAGK